jgi:hypothetical protein
MSEQFKSWDDILTEAGVDGKYDGTYTDSTNLPSVESAKLVLDVGDASYWEADKMILEAIVKIRRVVGDDVRFNLQTSSVFDGKIPYPGRPIGYPSELIRDLEREPYDKNEGLDSDSRIPVSIE